MPKSLANKLLTLVVASTTILGAGSNLVSPTFAQSVPINPTNTENLAPGGSNPYAFGVGLSAPLLQISASLNSIQGNHCDNLLVLIDRQNALTREYVPSNLVKLSDVGIPVFVNDRQLRQVVIPDLKQLFADAKSQGIDLWALSAYRSYDYQDALYHSYIQLYGQDYADKYSAIAGHSQHQLGTTLDFGTAENNFDLLDSFADTKAGKWLADNAYKYGFYISYPKGMASVTGYEYEPWHYRYVGKLNAWMIKNSGLIMQTYLQRYGIKPNNCS